MAVPSTQIGNSLSNLPTVQRFDAGDYKDAPNWFIQKFLPTLNLFSQAVYNIVNQGIDPQMNTRDEIYSFSFVCSSNTASSNTFNFNPKKFVGKPNGVIVAQCYNETAATPSAIGNPVTIDWYFNAGQVKILAIYGIASGNTYQIVLRIF